MTITSDPLQKIPLPPEPNSADELELLYKCNQNFQLAREAKKPLYRDWKRNYLLLSNRMWSDFRSQWMPSPSDSEVYPIMSGLIGWLTDQSVMYTLQAATEAGSPWHQYLEGLVDDLEAIMQSNWKVRNHQGSVTSAMWDAGLYGAGIVKTVWDQSLEKGMGDANLTHVDAWNFYPDPQATDETDGDFYIEVRRVSWAEVERRFPDTCDKLLSDLVYDTADSSIDSDNKPINTAKGPSSNPMSMTKGYPNAKTSSTGLPGQARAKAWVPEGIIVYEGWFRENRDTETPDPFWEPPDNDPSGKPPLVDVIYDDWKLIIWSSNTILLEAWASDLWDGAEHPYSRFVYEDTGEFWPTPLVSHLAPAQIAINRLLAALQQSAELTGNPILAEPSAAQVSATLITNRPGQRLRYNSQGGGNNTPSWLNPPSMSGDVLRLVQFWIERMENISGLSTVSKGKAPQARAAEGVVNQVQESGFIRVRSMLRNLERTLRRAGQIEAQLIVENYTEARTLSIIGPEGSSAAVVLRERHFIDAVDNEYAPFKYSIMVNAGSDTPTSRQARMSEATTLFTIKAIDRQALLESVNFPHWPQVEDRMKKAEQAAQQAAEASARSKSGRKS